MLLQSHVVLVAFLVVGLGLLLWLMTFRLRVLVSLTLDEGRVTALFGVGPVTRRLVFPSQEGTGPRERPATPRPHGPATALALTPALVHLLTSLRVDRLSWISEIGLPDAARAARTVGLAWVLKSAVASGLKATGRLVGSPSFRVTPHLAGSRFSTRLRCIVLVRGGDIITALAAAGWSLVKERGKGVWLKWPKQRIPSKAS